MGIGSVLHHVRLTPQRQRAEIRKGVGRVRNLENTDGIWEQRGIGFPTRQLYMQTDYVHVDKRKQAQMDRIGLKF